MFLQQNANNKAPKDTIFGSVVSCLLCVATILVYPLG